MKTRAAVVHQVNALTIETIELDPPQATEVLVRVRAAGRLPVNELITQHYSLDQAAQAFADMEAGTTARGVIVFD